jgi:hypothetical protein
MELRTWQEGDHMMESTPEQDKATVLEAFDTLLNKRDSAGGVLESGVSARARKEVQMTNGAVALLRKRWASLIAWVAAMDYSAADYTNVRIGGLEREVEQLKNELRPWRRRRGARFVNPARLLVRDRRPHR